MAVHSAPFVPFRWVVVWVLRHSDGWLFGNVVNASTGVRLWLAACLNTLTGVRFYDVETRLGVLRRRWLAMD